MRAMKIRILAFGIARDILKGSTLDLHLEEGDTLSEVRARLYRSFPELEKLSSLRFAVNSAYAEDDQPLRARDEVVLIPPVSGG